jgi:hypothetical protein
MPWRQPPSPAPIDRIAFSSRCIATSKILSIFATRYLVTKVEGLSRRQKTPPDPCERYPDDPPHQASGNEDHKVQLPGRHVSGRLYCQGRIDDCDDTESSERKSYPNPHCSCFRTFETQPVRSGLQKRPQRRRRAGAVSLARIINIRVGCGDAAPLPRFAVLP